MKALKNITFGLIISLALFAWVDKECVLFSNAYGYIIENSGNEESTSNSFAYDNDINEIDITLNHDIYLFNIKSLSGEKIYFSHFIPSQILAFSIWQPPKIS